MIQRTTRDYEVSLWSLQDSLIAILKPYGLEFRGQIEDGKLTDRDDGTQEFSFSIPMYINKNGEQIENPCWASVQSGPLLINLRKIKVIFNKDAEDKNLRKVYEFLITKVTERHEEGQLYCDISCEGLAFHELGKLGYKISLSPEDFYNDDYDWFTNGHWTTPDGGESNIEPIASLNYWNDKVFSTISNWTYEICMDWSSYSLGEQEQQGNLQDYTYVNDKLSVSVVRNTNKVYEDDFVDSWKNDEKTGALIPSHVTYAREKARVAVDIKESNIYNITQQLAEIFGVFCKYIYEHDDNYHIIGRKVVYYNNFLSEKNGAIDLTYKYNTSAITRVMDSTDLVTKLFVKDVENTASDAGLTSIINVGANKTQQDYILNFDYAHKIGAITDEQYNKIEQYNNRIRELNMLITPLSAQIISLQSQLSKLEAELTTRTNAIAADTEQIYSTKDLLNNLTRNTGILQVTNKNPQTAVLLQDTTTTYTSYYVKITQKGVYPETVKLYRTYNYGTSQLTNEITTGQIQFDEFGNVVKVTNLFLGADESKTVYLVYDYKPSLYYERIQAMWSRRLAEDTARKAQLQQQLSEINYKLYGRKSSYPYDTLNTAKLDMIDIYGRYESLIREKQQIIKQFNADMGPALREGYWQPETYTDYGDKYTDMLKVGFNYIGEQNKFVGASGNAAFMWDTELLDGEQKLYYQYAAEQKKIAYPCINLLKHPQILKLIQEHINDNINVYYTPVTSIEDNPAASNAPTLMDVPKTLLLVTNLYKTDNEGNLVINDEGDPVIREEVSAVYGEEFEYRPFLGYLCPQFAPGVYKKGYTYFYWEAKQPNDEKWVKVTDYYDTQNYENIANRYTFSVVDEFKNNIRFSSETNPQQIQLFSTTDYTFKNWQFRLVVRNNKGINIYEDGWEHGLSPTTIQIADNNIQITPVESNIMIGESDDSPTIDLQFNIQNKDESNIFELQYYRRPVGNTSINFNTWNLETEEEIEYSSVSQNNGDILTCSPTENSNQITYKLTLCTGMQADKEEWRFRLVSRNIQDYASNTPNAQQQSSSIRFSVLDADKIYYIDQNSNHTSLIYDENQQSYVLSAAINLYSLRQDLQPRSDLTNLKPVWYKKKEDSNDSLTNQNNVTIEWEKIENSCKYVATCNITFDNTNDDIRDFIELWDGYQIYPAFDNLTIENFGQALYPILDICLPIMNYQQLFINNQYNFITTQITTDSKAQFKITGKNIDNCIWHIQYGENKHYELNVDVQLSGEVTNETKTDTDVGTTYTAQTQKENEIVTSTLIITDIPMIPEQIAIFNSVRVYCEASNISDNYFSPYLERQSYQKSSIAMIRILPPIEFIKNNNEDYLIGDWWPCQDKARTLNLPYNWYDMSKKPGAPQLNNQVLEIGIQLSKPQDLYATFNYKELIYADIDSSSDIQCSLQKNTFEFTNEQQRVLQGVLTLQITPKQDLSSYKINDTSFIDITTTNNDQRYAYFIKLNIIYHADDEHPIPLTEYYCARIRQCPPVFNEGSQWEFIPGQAAIHEDQNFTLTFVGPATNKYSNGGQYVDTYEVTSTNFTTNIKGSLSSKLYISTFNINQNSVNNYQWRVNDPWISYLLVAGKSYGGSLYPDGFISQQTGIYADLKLMYPTSLDKIFLDAFFSGNDLPINYIHSNFRRKESNSGNIGILPIIDSMGVSPANGYPNKCRNPGLSGNLYLEAQNSWGTVKTKLWAAKGSIIYNNNQPMIYCGLYSTSFHYAAPACILKSIPALNYNGFSSEEMSLSYGS